MTFNPLFRKSNLNQNQLQIDLIVLFFLLSTLRLNLLWIRYFPIVFLLQNHFSGNTILVILLVTSRGDSSPTDFRKVFRNKKFCWTNTLSRIPPPYKYVIGLNSIFYSKKILEYGLPTFAFSPMVSCYN